MSVWSMRLLGSVAAASLLASCVSDVPPPPPTVPPPPPVIVPEPEPAPQSEPEPVIETPATDPQTGIFPATLELCPRMDISNQPDANGLDVTGYSPLVKSLSGVVIAMAPVGEACFSSGFGWRGGRLHKGIDLHNKNPTAVYAGGAGVIKELTYRDDYGNMIVIDHGGGMFTRYAHLQGFASGLSEGDTVPLGTRIGTMGNTASYNIPRHLHYELLTGDWGAQAGSFALTPVDIFKLAPAE